MSEEEKEARDILVNEIADILVGEYCKQCKICENKDTECYYGKAIDTIDDLIKKQQKEIEEYKKIVECIEEFKRLKRPVMELVHEMNKFEDEFVSKDKIKQIINKYVDIEEHLKYTSQELYGEDLKNMILELLGEDND